MSIITGDFETFYGTGYSLKSLTYEQYIKDPRFKVHGFGFQIDDKDWEYVEDRHVRDALNDLFYEGNDHTLVCHNTLFDGAILSWYYGLAAQTYWCTQAISRALWNQAPSSLDALAKRLWPDDPERRKGEELESFKDIRDLTPEQQKVMGGYCGNDVWLTFEAIKTLWPMMPDEELELLDLTLKMFIHPKFLLNRGIVEQHLRDVQAAKEKAVKESGTTKTTLASGPKFVQHIKDKFGLDVPQVHSPTPKNPDNYKYALAKDELVGRQFIREHRDEHPGLEEAFAGRYAVASTLEESRSKRLLDHSLQVHEKPDGVIALPLNYAAAHTIRWGGTNKINAQNFGRGSPLRRAIEAPEGYRIGVGDLSQIEARMLAWEAGQRDLLQMFRNGDDIYSIFATDIYGYTVHRKLKATDEQGNYIDSDGSIVNDPDHAHKPFALEGMVGKASVLGLGYQMGPQKFQDTLEKGTLGPSVKLPFQKCYDIVHGVYRKRNHAIVAYWAECGMAIKDMMLLYPGEQKKWRSLVIEQGRLRLPNGMYLNYPGLKYEVDEESGYDEITYWNGKYRTKIYPGKLCENIIQALARIVIGYQMIRVNKWLQEEDITQRVMLTVHDEIISLMLLEGIDERIQHKLAMMRQPPDWCPDLPLDSEGGYDVGYSK